jgi:thiamine biosynthesis protein ThiS
MDVLVNGELKPLLGFNNLSDALITWGYTMDMPMAVAVNYSVIPNSSYAEVLLKHNDVIEILMPMQGG